MRPLRSKEKKQFLKQLKEQYGFEGEFPYLLFVNNKDKYYIQHPDYVNFELTTKINGLGLYFGERMKDGFRLSIEASQLIGLNASKNILELNDKEIVWLFQGNDFYIKHSDGFVILKFKDDFVGCAKIKENKLLNFIPKTRRISVDFEV